MVDVLILKLMFSDTILVEIITEDHQLTTVTMIMIVLVILNVAIPMVNSSVHIPIILEGLEALM